MMMSLKQSVMINSMDNKEYMDKYLKLSDLLLYALQNTFEMNLAMTYDGYVELNQLLIRKPFVGVTFRDILCVIENPDNQRFEIKNEDNVFYIRDLYSNKIPLISEDELLNPILCASEYPFVVYGTCKDNLLSIQRKGISRTNSNQIKMATSINPNKDDADVYIIIDIARAMQDGISFFVNKKGVVFSPGCCISNPYNNIAMSNDDFESLSHSNATADACAVIPPQVLQRSVIL